MAYVRGLVSRKKKCLSHGRRDIEDVLIVLCHGRQHGEKQ